MCVGGGKDRRERGEREREGGGGGGSSILMPLAGVDKKENLALHHVISSFPIWIKRKTNKKPCRNRIYILGQECPNNQPFTMVAYLRGLQ